MKNAPTLRSRRGLVISFDLHCGSEVVLNNIERLVGVTQDVIQDSTVLCDLSILTEKQREAVELAVERGYYARDGDVDMDALADDLDISKSALSRRFKSAEAKLMLERSSRSAEETC